MQASLGMWCPPDLDCHKKVVQIYHIVHPPDQKCGQQQVQDEGAKSDFHHHLHRTVLPALQTGSEPKLVTPLKEKNKRTREKYKPGTMAVLCTFCTVLKPSSSPIFLEYSVCNSGNQL